MMVTKCKRKTNRKRKTYKKRKTNRKRKTYKKRKTYNIVGGIYTTGTSRRRATAIARERATAMREAYIAQQEEIAAAQARQNKIIDRWVDKLSHYVYTTYRLTIKGDKLTHRTYNSYVNQLIRHPTYINESRNKFQVTKLGTLDDFTTIMENKSDAELDEHDPDITQDEIDFWKEVKDSL